ncbi:MAG: hypothetical protein QCI82_04015 [Candidatus Thermoplasmatota archaeon]|nr:hypothetical protein [Candidatus Thermoplasmatota archaeon]
MRRRETAHPLLIADLLSAREVRSGEDEGGMTRYETPSGASIFRAWISGVLMERENIGTEDSPLYRMRVADPTGGITLISGKFNQDLLNVSGSIPCPSFISVIGKVKTFKGRGGESVISINPEIITAIDRQERQDILLLSIREALSRIWSITERGPNPMRSASVPQPQKDISDVELEDKLRDMLLRSMEAYDKGFYSALIERGRSEGLATAHEDDIDPLEGYEDDVLDMIRSLDSGKGARWDSVIDLIDKKRLSRDIIEEVISNLLDKGLLYEPMLGYLKAI